MLLPSLPSREQPWPPDILEACQILNDHYSSSARLLESRNHNHHRLIHHITMLISDAYPLILSLDSASGDGRVPTRWVREVAQAFVELTEQLADADQESTGEVPANVAIPEPVTLERTGRPGRPRKIVDLDLLHAAMEPGMGISKEVLANSLGIGRKTLRKRLQENDIESGFSNITDADLDDLIREERESGSSSGQRYLTGFIRKKGLRVQRDRVLASMQRVDGVGRALRKRKAARVPRRQYEVSRPNALWHIDGHHKLIPWGIVIHGVVDGYSRKITGMRASTNNRASTVLDMFLDAIIEHGVPSRVRGDRGGENRDISVLMILLRGINRASFIWGSSVFNTRIERLWVEVGKQFARRWRVFFRRLQRLHHLDRSNPGHLWLIHHLFLEAINLDCEKFVGAWNSHPLSGEGHNRTPQALALLGGLEHGVYIDDCDGLSPEEIIEFYGIDDEEELTDEDDSGDEAKQDDSADEDDEMAQDDATDEDDAMAQDDSADEDDAMVLDEQEDNNSANDEEDGDRNAISDDGELAYDEGSASEEHPDHLFAQPELPDILEDLDEIIREEGRNIRHKPAAVPRHECPLNEKDLVDFDFHLNQLQQAGSIPMGYGLLPEEWDEDGYPSIEKLKVGKSEVTIQLEDSVWRPRAEQWARALYLLQAIQFENPE